MEDKLISAVDLEKDLQSRGFYPAIVKRAIERSSDASEKAMDKVKATLLEYLERYVNGVEDYEDYVFNAIEDIYYDLFGEWPELN